MEVLLMPTVGRATDVNMNLLISIPCNLSLSSAMAASFSVPNTLR